MTLGQLKVHRELQYLRAAGACRPKRGMKRGELARRRRYVEQRYGKLVWAENRLLEGGACDVG
jgi:hypothetical protein